MPRKSKKPVRKQTHSPTGKVVGQVGQILLPMIAGIAATKADLTEWVYEQGLTALHLLLREDAEEIAGLKGKHEKERTHNHWGSTNGELSFGGRRIQVSRPRVRSKSGEEASLPHFEAFREEDPLPERVLNQILVGVSTRNYESSLDKPAAKLKSRGTSKSAASRHLVSQTTKKLEEYLSRRLEEFELAALMMDGLEVAGQTVVVTLGITIDGTKVPLGIWLGSTENSRVCTAMLQNLLERGLRDRRIDSLRSGRRQRDPQSTRRRFWGSRGYPKMPAPQTPKSTLVPSQVPSRLRAPDNEGSVQMQECRQGAQATSGIGVVARAKRLRRSCRKPSRRDGRDPHGCEARSTRVTSQISGHDKRHRESQRHHPQSLEKRQAVEESFHDSPMDRSRRRHGGEKVSRRIKGYRHMGALVHALRSKQKSLDSDEVAA